MGSEESMMVWFGSVDVGSAVLTPTDYHRTLGTLAAGGYTFARTVIATPDHGAVATDIIVQLIGVPAWWHCRWQLYLARMAWYLKWHHIIYATFIMVPRSPMDSND